MTRLLAACALLLLGCGAAPQGEASSADTTGAERAADVTSASEEPAMDLAPLPYTADAIAAACAPGRSHLYAHVNADGETSLHRTTFVESEPGIAEFQSATVDEAGVPLNEPMGGVSTWEELRQHAAFPAAQTTLTETSLDVPAGAFDVVLYTVRADDGSLTRAWFAPSLPGPPVQMIVEEPDGSLRWSMTLLEFTDPRAGD